MFEAFDAWKRGEMELGLMAEALETAWAAFKDRRDDG
jgi:hypothetical protein